MQKVDFEYFVRPDDVNFQFKALACSSPSFALTIPADTEKNEVLNMYDFENLEEIYTWCRETLGTEFMDWRMGVMIGHENRTRRDDSGGRRWVRECSIQIHMKDSAMLALFKLRWSS